MTAAYADLFLEGMYTVLHYDFSNAILMMMMMMMMKTLFKTQKKYQYDNRKQRRNLS